MPVKSPSVCLITIVSGPDHYRRYARRLMAAAADHFKPSRDVSLRILPGREGPWPTGTMYRYHAILEHAESGELQFDYLYHIDADMMIEAQVGAEILADGITATQHPGYVNMPPEILPFERRPVSMAYVPSNGGQQYFCGGFIGGKRGEFLRMAESIALNVDRDAAGGITGCWHDESHLNAYLVHNPPAKVLSPAYCHPDNDGFYLAMWPEAYPRIIVALDKSDHERDGR